MVNTSAHPCRLIFPAVAHIIIHKQPHVLLYMFSLGSFGKKIKRSSPPLPL
jgi:hypothetical protein